MLTCTLHSRKLRRDFNFCARSSGGYVFLEEPGRPGLSGVQPCVGGGFRGDTLYCGPSEASLERVCRRWLRQHVAGTDAPPTREERAHMARIQARLDAEDAAAAAMRPEPYSDELDAEDAAAAAMRPEPYSDELDS